MEDYAIPIYSIDEIKSLLEKNDLSHLFFEFEYDYCNEQVLKLYLDNKKSSYDKIYKKVKKLKKDLLTIEIRIIIVFKNSFGYVD